MILMIAAHATDAFLADTWKHNEVWYRASIMFGFVAPGYLLFSGMTLRVALQRRGDDLFRFGPRTRLLLRRAIAIILLGYWLQIPVLSLRQLVIIQRPDELARLFNANILQVIGLTIIAVTLAAWGMRSLGRIHVAALIAGLVVVAASPLLLSTDGYHSLPLPFRFYAAPQPVSVFPLFPFAAYMLFGFASAPSLIHAAERRRGWLAVACAGGLLVGAAFGLDAVLTGHAPYDSFWGPTPQQVLFRLGGLLMATGLAILIERTVSAGRTEPLEFAGRRSLGIYLLHLMLIYGSVMNMGMRYWMYGAFNGTLTPIATGLAIVAIIGITWYAVRFWQWLRVAYPSAALWAKRAWWGIFWALFLIEP